MRIGHHRPTNDEVLDNRRGAGSSVETWVTLDVPAHDEGAQFTPGAVTVGAALAAEFAAAVAHPAGADGVAVPAPRPAAVATPLRERVEFEGAGKLAHAVGVVVDFDTADVATGDTDAERNMGIGARHGGPPRFGAAPAAIPR